MNTIKQLTPAQFHAARAKADHRIVDVRNRDEFASGSEASACWPVSEIDGASVSAFVREHNLDPSHTVVLLCASGKRAQLAADKLRALLPNPIAIVQGGRAALQAAAGTPRMSIERQIRIAAGALVILGALAALLIHPLAVIFCALVGAGLVFAGLTDWCGLGLLLRRMPWNRS